MICPLNFFQACEDYDQFRIANGMSPLLRHHKGHRKCNKGLARAASLVGGQKNAHQSIFLYNIIQSSRISLARNSVFIGPNSFEFGTETRYIVSQETPKFGAN